MYDDLHELYLQWSNRTGRTSILDFGNEVFERTGVMLSDVLTDEERAQILGSFDDDEALLEGMDSGP